MSRCLYIMPPMRKDGEFITWTVAVPAGVTDVQIEQALQDGGIARMAVTTPEKDPQARREVHVREETIATAQQVEEILEGLGAAIVG